MSIASLSTTQVPQPLAAGAAAAAPASSAQGPFGTQLQSLLGGQSSATSDATATAYQTEPGRGTPAKAHHHRGHHASSTDASAANGTANGQTTASAQSGASGASGAGQQTPGGVLVNDLMRGLQAYGATTTLM
jgi:hypothetical protein